MIRRDQTGFTLVEMLFAIGILTFGITSLIGVLSVGVSTRRTAEQRVRSAYTVDAVVQRIEQELLADIAFDPMAEDDELDLPALERQHSDDYGGIDYTVRLSADPDYPELVLATIRVAWLEQGESYAQVYRRLMRREKPFPQRVDALRRQP
ncbi:MAG: type II secretion system protein [Planctomycetes bacterium]|nr:type II secretion system protein [Planctomycetota bacterium]